MTRSRRWGLSGLVARIAVAACGVLVVVPGAAADSSALGTRTMVSTGQVVGWGFDGRCCPYEYLGQQTPPEGLTDVIAIAAGDYHSLALRDDGTVVGWGLDESGQATPPGSLSGVVAIAAGSNHSLALLSDGTVVGWGENGVGEATAPAGLSDVIAIAAGANFSLALRADGTVVAWGFPGRGTPPPGLREVAALDAGDFHGVGVRADGSVVAWGTNGDGSPVAQPPAELTDVSAVAAGFDYSLAVRRDGSVVGWGRNTVGQTTPPPGLTGVTAVAAGFNHSLALLADGSVVGWGQPADGRTVPPADLGVATAIAAGERHSLALTTTTRDVFRLAAYAGRPPVLVYARGPRALTSGDFVISPATGRVRSIVGTGTLAGATYSLDLNYYPGTRTYRGVVEVADGAYSAYLEVVAGRFEVTRSGDTVRAHLYARGPHRGLQVVIRIDDLG